MDAHKASWGFDGDPEGWAPLKAKENELKENFERAAKRCREETLEKSSGCESRPVRKQLWWCVFFSFVTSLWDWRM